jgi:hypothetical protein
MTAITETFKFANHYGYSDVNPYEVVRQISDKTIEVRAMSAKRDSSYKPEFVVGGFSAVCVNQEDQQWVITSNPNAHIIRIRLRKDGRWYDAHGNRYNLSAKPDKFYDYNF